MAKHVWSGLESAGKSLKLAKIVKGLADRNSKWYKVTGVQRPIVSNLHFSDSFHDYVTNVLKVPIIYWKHLDDLIGYDNADVIMDEVGNYFDSRLWADLSLDVRMWLTQGAKSGIDIYGTAQDFAQVDKSFRRLVNSLHEVVKIAGSERPAATKPPVKRIWGVCVIRELDPKGYDEDKKKFASGGLIPSFMMISKKDTDIFDTKEKISRSVSSLRHEERFCLKPGCGFRKVVHV